MNEKKLPLTPIQIEICDFILKLDSGASAYSEVNSRFENIKSGDDTICTSFLFKNDLIYSASTLMFTIKGAKYRYKGIVKFIQHERRKDFFKLPILRFSILFITLLISLTFNVVNCIRTNIPEDIHPTSKKNNNVPEFLLEQNLKIDSNNRELKPVIDIVKDSLKEIKHIN